MKTMRLRPSFAGFRFRFPRNLGPEIEATGFAVVRGRDVAMTPMLRRALARLVEDSRELPVDPYHRPGTRRRRYARVLYLPWSGEILPTPQRRYLQGSVYQPEFGGIDRQFPSFTAGVLSNPILPVLIDADYRSLPIAFRERTSTLAIDVGLHLIAYAPLAGIPAVSSPPGFHRDGEPYTVTHLLVRECIVGGDSGVAADPAGQHTLTYTLLEEPLDSLWVDDKQVYHCVTPVELAPGATSGLRAVLLIDFSPLGPELSGG